MNILTVVCLSLGMVVVPAMREITQAGVEDTNQPVYNGKPLSAWIKPLQSMDARVRQEALKALDEAVTIQFRMDSDWDLSQGAVSVFTEALKDKEQGIRATAAKALYKFGIGPEAEAEVARLSEALLDKNPIARREAAHNLLFQRPAAKAGIPSLTKALQDPDAYVRRQAAITLGFMGPEGKAAVPLLVEALKDESLPLIDFDRMDAAMALGRIGPDAKPAVPALVEALRDPRPWVRQEAALALGQIGAEAKLAVGELRRALKDEDREARASAAVALWRLEHKVKDTLPILIDGLKRKDEQSARQVASYTIKTILETLKEIGPEAKEAVPSLIPLLKDSQWGIRRATLEALNKIEPEQKE